eukprot:gene16420-19534_t
MAKILVAVILIMLTRTLSFGQAQETIFPRLAAIASNGTDFFNIDGIMISSQSVELEFSSKNILKKFKKFNIKESDLLETDSLIGVRNFYVSKTEKNDAGMVQNTSYYFVEHAPKKLTMIAFDALNKKDRALERQVARLIVENRIPRNMYESLSIDSINFAGRKIFLGSRCRWMNVCNVQCSDEGQMNWSVHKKEQDAKQTVIDQYNLIRAKRGGKILSEDSVSVVFEGTEVKAKKIVYDFTGIKSLLVGMSGGKTLTVYFVMAPVRANYVSCVMSFWDIDRIGQSGLPRLLEQVMKLNSP